MIKQGLYDPWYEHDACGLGVVANIKGKKTHKILKQAIEVLYNLDHRGGQGADRNSGDGAGILLQIPNLFFVKECAKLGIKLPLEGHYAAGMVFLPPDSIERDNCMRHLEKIVLDNGQKVLGWRDVPVNPDVLGEKSRSCMPHIAQIFIAAADNILEKLSIDDNLFERKLYVIRRQAENIIRYGKLPGGKFFYLSSLSARTIVYKGMLTTTQIDKFFPDLCDSGMETALALVHSRFSTNTFPSWERAHPYRYLMHNGEINTLRGNINWMRARQSMCHNKIWGKDLPKVLPIIDETGSDSGMFDNCLEFLVLSGRSLPHAVMMMIPEPYANNPYIDEDLKGFFEYHNCLMEPWDGPAAMAYTDGRTICAALDRNGLRPSRYYVTEDQIILASEVGVLEIEPRDVKLKERLKPGKMLVIDTVAGKIISNEEIKHRLAIAQPYKQWVREHMYHLDKLDIPISLQQSDLQTLRKRQITFGYTLEEINKTLIPMAATAKDPVGAMGADIPPAVLSKQPQLLFNYFKQLFAQVTNPPIDAIREKLYTDISTTIGPEYNTIDPKPESCRQIALDTPILSNEQLAKIKNIEALHLPGFQCAVLHTLYDVHSCGTGLKQALDKLCQDADAAIAQGKSLLVISDRGINENLAPIPALLAVACLHHHLIRNATRLQASILLESAEPREVHHLALLLGYGVSGINPYLVFESLENICQTQMLRLDYEQAVKNYIQAAADGIAKVLSKMGISTVQSYRGAQIFEALGISAQVIDEYFMGTPSRIGGIGLEEIARETEERHNKAFASPAWEDNLYASGSVYQYRSGGEEHMYNPQTIFYLQQACRNNDYKMFNRFTAMIDESTETSKTLRSLLEFSPQRLPISIEEVESVDSICKRFKTGAMSYGSLSQEAHECLAMAMNVLGGKSNTGEGGEHPSRYVQNPADKYSKRSSIKQVASGRFGVTSQYLVSADEIQIKIAQGAKPGEGGQLPGSKVYPWIAEARGTTAGVELISPPPHHDIYSIEDLAELIFDLKNANPRAKISVKLVSEVGIGTIAAGVAKACADTILISGCDGGTGASPRTGIRHAGLPWELGLAETHQTLLLNNLRGRVRLETDGKLMTGRDVVIAALLGAEEFGFATAPLIAMGCIMMRVCNLNTCPVGIATQDPKLRANFRGQVEHVINFMHFIAEQMREYMAQLGFKTIEEMVGRTEVLIQKPTTHPKACKVDLSALLHCPPVDPHTARHCVQEQNHLLEKTLDARELLAICREPLTSGTQLDIALPIKNTDRVVGTMLGSEITRKYGAQGLPEDTIKLRFTGSAGQSFGAFIPRGMTLYLQGDANDHVGKGLSGGKIAIAPSTEATFQAQDNVIIGNVAFYGATSGRAYIAGRAGERFCIRNSGATVVAEGVGDHGCEYMTGGTVVILGKTGRNFAAGMSGGTAYIYDPNRELPERCNKASVLIEPVQDPIELLHLQKHLHRHLFYTKSKLAAQLLDNWSVAATHFVKVIPEKYKRIIEKTAAYIESGLSKEAATIKVFQEEGGK